MKSNCVTRFVAREIPSATKKWIVACFFFKKFLFIFEWRRRICGWAQCKISISAWILSSFNDLDVRAEILLRFSRDRIQKKYTIQKSVFFLVPTKSVFACRIYILILYVCSRPTNIHHTHTQTPSNKHIFSLLIFFARSISWSPVSYLLRFAIN